MKLPSLLALTALLSTACGTPQKLEKFYVDYELLPIGIIAVDGVSPTHGEKLLVDGGAHDLELWCKGERTERREIKPYDFRIYTTATVFAIPTDDGSCEFVWAVTDGDCSYCAEIKLPPGSSDYQHMVPGK